VDHTGLQGTYDFIFEWSPDSDSAPTSDGHSQKTVSDSFGVSFEQTLKDQLGLRLVPQKGPFEVLAIDHAEHPSEN